MDNLQILEKREVLGKEFTIYGTKEEPLFNANDVAKWIENKNVSQMLKVVGGDEKALYTMYRVDGSTNKSWFLTEDGLYEVLMQSRKEIAKQFKKQVKVILKEIRLNGGYIATNENDSDEMIMARALVVAQRTIERKDKLIKEKQKITDYQAPKVEYTDKVLASDNLLTVTQIAKDFGLSARKLNSILSDEGIQFKQGKQWFLYQEYADKGYTKSFTTVDEDGKVYVNTKWTQKGKQFIYDLLIELGYEIVEGK